MPLLFRTHLVTEQQAQEHQERFEALLAGDQTPGTKPEILSNGLFSMRVNQEARIIFTYIHHRGELHPLMIGVAEKHNYQDFDKKSLYSDYLKNHLEEFKQKIDEFYKDNNTQDLSEKNQITLFNKGPVHIIGKKAIIFDEQQSNIKAPAIIEGPAGSGKTCIAFSHIQRKARELQAGEKILYVTQSKNLADNIKAMLTQTSEDIYLNQGTIHVFAYDELLGKLYNGLVFEKETSNAVKDWLLNTTGAIGKQVKPKDRPARAEKILQEFRVISGFLTDEEYFEAGEKKTLFPKGQRKEILKLYQTWKTSTSKQHYPAFFRVELPAEDERKYHSIFVDESQDLSYLQLANLKGLLKPGYEREIIFLFDPKQRLHDDISKILFAQDLLNDEKTKEAVVPQSLSICYRCPPRVMRVAQWVNNTRLSLTPRAKQESSIQLLEGEHGDVIWHDPKSSEGIKSLQDKKHDSDACIITDAENKKILIAEGYSRVFTPEEIKGLQYRTVILYEAMSQPIFYQINTQLGSEEGANKEDNVHLTTPLCGLFTAITRAEHEIIFYQSNDPRLNNLTKPIQALCNRTQSQTVRAQTSVEAKLQEAESYFRQGYLEQAEAILMNEVYLGASQRTELVANKLKSWKSDEPEKVTFNLAVYRYDDNKLNELVQNSSQDHRNQFLSQVLAEKDFRLVAILMLEEYAGYFKWDITKIMSKLGKTKQNSFAQILLEVGVEKKSRLSKEVVNIFKEDAVELLLALKDVATQKKSELQGQSAKAAPDNSVLKAKIKKREGNHDQDLLKYTKSLATMTGYSIPRDPNLPPKTDHKMTRLMEICLHREDQYAIKAFQLLRVNEVALYPLDSRGCNAFAYACLNIDFQLLGMFFRRSDFCMSRTLEPLNETTRKNIIKKLCTGDVFRFIEDEFRDIADALSIWAEKYNIPVTAGEADFFSFLPYALKNPNSRIGKEAIALIDENDDYLDCLEICLDDRYRDSFDWEKIISKDGLTAFDLLCRDIKIKFGDVTTYDPRSPQLYSLLSVIVNTIQVDLHRPNLAKDSHPLYTLLGVDHNILGISIILSDRFDFQRMIEGLSEEGTKIFTNKLATMKVEIELIVKPRAELAKFSRSTPSAIKESVGVDKQTLLKAAEKIGNFLATRNSLSQHVENTSRTLNTPRG